MSFCARPWDVVRAHPARDGRALYNSRLAHPLLYDAPKLFAIRQELFQLTTSDFQIAAVYGVMMGAPQHGFYVCTRNLARMRAFYRWCGTETLDTFFGCARAAITTRGAHPLLRRGTVWPPRNIVLAARADTQEEYERHVDDLQCVPIAASMLVTELHEAIALKPHLLPSGVMAWSHDASDAALDRLRALRDSCAAHAVPFFLSGVANGEEISQLLDGATHFELPLGWQPTALEKI